MRKQHWFGILICVLAVVPGFVVGAILATLYKIMTGWDIGYNPDFFMLRTLFGVETPGLILQWIAFTALPTGVHGAVAGAIASWLAGTVYKGNNIEIVAYTTGALYTGIFLLALLLAILNAGLQLKFAEAVCQLIGLWVGLISVAGPMQTELGQRQTVSTRGTTLQ